MERTKMVTILVVRRISRDPQGVNAVLPAAYQRRFLSVKDLDTRTCRVRQGRGRDHHHTERCPGLWLWRPPQVSGFTCGVGRPGCRLRSILRVLFLLSRTGWVVSRSYFRSSATPKERNWHGPAGCRGKNCLGRRVLLLAMG